MVIELTAEERDRLVQLLDAAILELGAEIHHTRTFKDDLKDQRQEFRQMRDRLAAGGMPAQPTSGALVGSP